MGPKGSAGPGDAGADDRADLLRRSAAALVELAGDCRLVLFVDDGHLLDITSALLVNQLATTNAAFVLVTVRTGERVHDPVLGLWKDGLAERVDLAPLGIDAITDLLAAVVGGPVDPAAAAELAARSQGNVLFLHELVVGALDDGTLADDNGTWRLRRPLSPSARLVELVSFGEPLGLAELTALADSMDHVEALERRALVSSGLNGRRLELRLAHPLYGDVVRSRLSPLRERAIARALAEAVEATGARRKEDTLRTAAWRLTGGGAPPATLLAGARAARWRYDSRTPSAWPAPRSTPVPASMPSSLRPSWPASRDARVRPTGSWPRWRARPWTKPSGARSPSPVSTTRWSGWRDPTRRTSSKRPRA